MALNCETDAIRGSTFQKPAALSGIIPIKALVFPGFRHDLPTIPISWQAYDVCYRAGITGNKA